MKGKRDFLTVLSLEKDLSSQGKCVTTSKKSQSFFVKQAL
jgi:hypothetical protein